MSTPELLTAREVGDFIGISRYTVYNWVRAGKLPGPWITKGYKRWRRSDIENWLKEHGNDANYS